MVDSTGQRMERAHDSHAPDQDAAQHDAATAAAPVARSLPAQVLWLQRAAGNAAVSAQLARQPAPTGLPDKAPSSAPPVPGKSTVVAAPPPTAAVKPEEGPHPGADLGADHETVTLTVVIRELHLKGRDPSSIDWFHEPGVEIEATPGNAPKPVVTAAISALNYHLRIHGKDIAEIALGAKAGVDHEGKPLAEAELKAQLSFGAAFSIVVGTSLKAAPHSEDQPEDGSVPLAGHGSPVTLEWSPVSIGVQFKLDAEDKPDRVGPGDYAQDMEDGKVGQWVARQISAAELGQLEPTTVVDELITAMRGAGSEAAYTMRLGEREEVPPGISRAIARAAQLIVRAKPSLAHIQAVRVSVEKYDPAEKRYTVQRRFAVPVASSTVVTVPDAPPPQRTWGAPD